MHPHLDDLILAIDEATQGHTPGSDRHQALVEAANRAGDYVFWTYEPPARRNRILAEDALREVERFGYIPEVQAFLRAAGEEKPPAALAPSVVAPGPLFGGVAA